MSSPGEVTAIMQYAAILPASHYVVGSEKVTKAVTEIRREMLERVAWFTDHHKLIEAQRIQQRTQYDMEMLEEIGFCSGIENYSRILAGRPPGSVPYTLLDHFPEDFLLIVDESHVTLPQVRCHVCRKTVQKTDPGGLRIPAAQRIRQPAAQV